MFLLLAPPSHGGQTIVSQPGLDRGAGLGFDLDIPTVGPGREQRGNPYVHLGHQRSPSYGVSLTPASETLRPPHPGTQVHKSGCCSPLTKRIPIHPPTHRLIWSHKGKQEGSAAQRPGPGQGPLRGLQVSESPGALCCCSSPRNAETVVEWGESTEEQGDMRGWVTSVAQEPGSSLQRPALSLEDTQEPCQLPMPTAQPFCPPSSPHGPYPWPGPTAVSQDQKRPLL